MRFFGKSFLNYAQGGNRTRWPQRTYTLNSQLSYPALDWLRCYITEIFDSKYEWTDISTVVNNLKHLDKNQQQDLLAVLQRHASIFDGTLGTYPHKKFHIEIDPKAKSV